jgi:molecular chaperone GrpE
MTEYADNTEHMDDSADNLGTPDNLDSVDATHDWDEGLQELADGVLADAAADVPTDVVDAEPAGPAAESAGATGDLGELLAERTLDLQRLQAEYVNYKRRVDRDRDVARSRGIEAVLADLLPVLDGIDAARAHGELEGGAAMLADEVTKVTEKYGLQGYGAEGDPFDPHIHEALMQIDKPGYAVASVAQVFQKGYAIGDRTVRPARVGVAEPTAPEAEPAKE